MKAIGWIVLGLLAFPVSGMGAERDGMAKMAAVEAEWDQLHGDWMAEFRAAGTDEEKKAVYRKRPRPAEHLDRMLALLKEHGGDAGSLEYAAWMMRHSPGQMPDGLLEIVAAHKETKEFASVVPFLADVREGGEERALFDWARSSSPHKEVQAVAAFSRAIGRGLSEEERLIELRFVVENAGDLELFGTKIRESAEGQLFAAENIVIGKEAPEIEGEDLEGVHFKLSDYRGKVVVLDFWGHW